MKKSIFFLLCLTAAFLCAEEPASSDTVDITKLSEAFGHLLGKNLESLGMKFDVDKVVQGFRDAYEGKPAPMTEAECEIAITTAQEIAFKEVASANLKKAEEFLIENKNTEGVSSLEENKLQYLILREGTGATVEETFTPLIEYTGKFLDGTTFGASKEKELVNFEDEMIPGFRKGLLGMKEGEKRTLYIHPDLGFSTHDYNHPNTLLMFEIEVLQANASHSEPQDSLSESLANPEIANPFQEPKILR